MRSLSLAAAAMIVALTTVVLPATVRSEEKQNPIVAQVKESLKDPSRPFTMLVTLKVKEGSEEKFEKAFAKAVAGTRKEKGNRAYELSRDAKAPTNYIVYERWQNLEALEAHLKSKHITTLLAELSDLLASPPELKVFLPAD